MQHIRVSIPNGVSPTDRAVIMREIGDLIEPRGLEYNIVPETASVPLSEAERAVAVAGLQCVPACVDFLEALQQKPPITDEQLHDLYRIVVLLDV